MSKIIQIKKLYDYYHDMCFGYIGMDLDTRKIRYYSHYNNKQKWCCNILYEFDPKKLQDDNIISWHMHYCKQKLTLIKSIPEELDLLIKSFLKQHRNYNITNNYSIENIDKNSVDLYLKCQSDFSLFSSLEYRAIYIPVLNVVELNCNKSTLDSLSQDDKCSLIHELGHMKVSSYRLDEANNLLIVKTGFYLRKVVLEPTILENNDIFYKTLNTVPKENNIEEALEEIINDLDCSLAFKSFKGNYPRLGNLLNGLCNGSLTYARYNGGLDKVYMELQKIIDSRDLAHELLVHIGDSIYGCNPEISENKALQLIKKYEEKL